MVKGVGYFFATKFYFTESQGFARYSPKIHGNIVFAA